VWRTALAGDNIVWGTVADVDEVVCRPESQSACQSAPSDAVI
jgi:hypothetical protein